MPCPRSSHRQVGGRSWGQWVAKPHPGRLQTGGPRRAAVKRPPMPTRPGGAHGRSPRELRHPRRRRGPSGSDSSHGWPPHNGPGRPGKRSPVPGPGCPSSSGAGLGCLFDRRSRRSTRRRGGTSPSHRQRAHPRPPTPRSKLTKLTPPRSRTRATVPSTWRSVSMSNGRCHSKVCSPWMTERSESWANKSDATTNSAAETNPGGAAPTQRCGSSPVTPTKSATFS